MGRFARFMRFAGCGFLVGIALAASSAVGTDPPHEAPPTGPWVPAPRRIASVAGGCQSHVVRDSYSSIQVNVDARGCNIPGDAANEPSIAVDPTDPRKIVIGWRQFDSVLSNFRQAGWAYSHDAGHTWVFRGSPTPGVFGSDPVLASGPGGEVYYLSTNFDETRLFGSFDGGITWPLHTQAIPRFYDKPWMAVDRTGGPGRGNIYLTSLSYGGFFRSVNAGSTFMEYRPPGVYGETLTVAPDGAVYLAGGGSGGQGWALMRSVDAGDPSVVPTFSVKDFCMFCSGAPSFVGPNPGGLLGQLWVATYSDTSAGAIHVYLLAPGPLDPANADFDFADVVFMRSMDGGLSWTRPIPVNDDPPSPMSWQWFAMMSVAPNGRIDAVWNDTRNYGHPPYSNLSELYYAYSIDTGSTWSTNVPLSPVFDTYIGWPNQTKIGDYYHMVSDNLGVNVAYAATFNGEQDIYFLRIGPWDCNGNELDDLLDISELRSGDCNANDVPDECEYRVDVNGDGVTTLSDFAEFQRGLTGPHDPVASARGAGGSRPAAGAPGSEKSAIGNWQLAIPCVALLDPDHDGDSDLHDFYLLQHVFVGP